MKMEKGNYGSVLKEFYTLLLTLFQPNSLVLGITFPLGWFPLSPIGLYAY